MGISRRAGCKSKPRKPLTVSQEEFVNFKAGLACLELPAECRNILIALTLLVFLFCLAVSGEEIIRVIKCIKVL